MKKLILAAAMAATAALGGCATTGSGVWACDTRSNVLIGPCKRPDLSDCAPNYHVINQCRAQGNWGCYADSPRQAMQMDPTLGSCNYQQGTGQFTYQPF